MGRVQRILLDFGAWPQSYRLRIRPDTNTPKRTDERLRKAGWSFVGNRWVRDGATLMVHPLGFGILEGVRPPVREVLRLAGETWMSDLSFRGFPRTEPLPEDGEWTEIVTVAMTVRTGLMLAQWATGDMWAGIAADADRAVDRCRRMAIAFPPGNGKAYDTAIESACDAKNLLVDCGKVAQRSSCWQPHWASRRGFSAHLSAPSSALRPKEERFNRLSESHSY